MRRDDDVGMCCADEVLRTATGSVKERGLATHAWTNTGRALCALADGWHVAMAVAAVVHPAEAKQCMHFLEPSSIQTPHPAQSGK